MVQAGLAVAVPDRAALQQLDVLRATLAVHEGEFGGVHTALRGPQASAVRVLHRGPLHIERCAVLGHRCIEVGDPDTYVVHLLEVEHHPDLRRRDAELPQRRRRSPRRRYIS